MKTHQAGFEVPRRGNLEALFQGGPLVALIKFVCELWLPVVAQQFLSRHLWKHPREQGQGVRRDAGGKLGMTLPAVGMQGRTNLTSWAR